MSKPNGLALTCGDGAVRLSVTAPTHAEDAVWEAVQAAQAAGWTPKRLRLEVAQAWEYEAQERLKADMRVLREEER